LERDMADGVTKSGFAVLVAHDGDGRKLAM
jgi:hypothetical protein